MMKNFLKVLVMSAAICIGLTGCGHEHTWNEATCTEPKTCAGCGATEGEVLGHDWTEATCAAPKTCARCGETEGTALDHDWTEATCSAPKTCSRCGKTEGEALEHTLTEANYQQPAACTVCGKTEGEPLVADFEKYGLVNNMIELDKTYDYVMQCFEDLSRTTIAKALLTNYQTFESAEGFPAADGYEWRSLDFTVLVGDDSAWNYGANLDVCFEDYYDVVSRDESSRRDDDGMFHFTVNYNGIDYPDCEMTSLSRAGRWTGWTDQAYEEYGWAHSDSFVGTLYVRVPVGYDGFVFGLRNGTCEWGEGQHIFDLNNTDTLFFRFK